MLWEDPPPENEAKPDTRKYVDFFTALAKNPGRWARHPNLLPYATARGMATGNYKVQRDLGIECEVRWKKPDPPVRSNINGRDLYVVWVRVIKEDTP